MKTLIILVGLPILYLIINIILVFISNNRINYVINNILTGKKESYPTL